MSRQEKAYSTNGEQVFQQKQETHHITREKLAKDNEEREEARRSSAGETRCAKHEFKN
jgi:hypothetical protein